jgi:hypothetical protein
MLRKVLLVVALASVVAGCAHRLRADMIWTPLPFDEAEYAALPKAGTGVVKGQVFAKTIGGTVKTGAGSEVLLIPATKFNDQWYRETFVYQHAALTNPDARYATFNRVKTADGDGRFEYTKIPAGRYYVLSHVTWEAVSDNPYSRRLGVTDTQGGWVSRVVEVKDGETTEAILSR